MNGTTKYKWYQGRFLVLVIFSFIMFFLQALLTSGCMNTVWPVMADAHGWDVSNIYAWQTPFSIMTAVLTIPVSALIAKKGPRFVTSLGFVLIGIVTIIWGQMSSLPGFIVMMGLTYFFIIFNN